MRPITALVAATIILPALPLVALLAPAAQEAPAAPPSPWDAHILELEQQAIDEAFRQHIIKLYANWLADYSQPDVPRRVRTGARNARAAYVRAMEQIELRKN